jgi:hypothetical protein
MKKVYLRIITPARWREAKAAGALMDDRKRGYWPGIPPAGFEDTITAPEPIEETYQAPSLPPARAWSTAELEAFAAAGRASVAAARRAGVSEGKRWALSILERQAAGDRGVAGYSVELARAALQL